MFNLRALSLFSAFLAVSALPQDHSSEQSEAQISDPVLECTPYYYAPSGDHVKEFPTVWTPAKLLASDTDGQNMWASISSSIPTNIQPKGQPDGSTIGVTYDIANDPDCWWTETLCTTPKLAGLPPDVSSVPEPKTMGYGFDDGPNCTHNAFYNFLASQNQRRRCTTLVATCLTGRWRPSVQIADGHEICVHTWSHSYMTAFQSQDAFAELWPIKLVTGVTPTCWRPPFGDVDDRIRAIANALGLQTILWQHDSFDWENGVGNFGPADVDGNYWLFVNNLTGRQLRHKAINWYPKLKSTFSHIVPVGVALNKTQPYKEPNYHLPTFEQYIAGQVTIPNSG
ncbi:carbohydrate esterase family 4 protein [Lactarius hengduanensis]|nr:carbohydrate esterase family 4 protein [Lactarius hengduanensis]